MIQPQNKITVKAIRTLKLKLSIMENGKHTAFYSLLVSLVAGCTSR